MGGVAGPGLFVAAAVILARDVFPSIPPFYRIRLASSATLGSGLVFGIKPQSHAQIWNQVATVYSVELDTQYSIRVWLWSGVALDSPPVLPNNVECWVVSYP